MEQKKEKGKIAKLIDLIKELYKTPRGKGILFFAGYFLFFLVFIFIVRFSPRGEVFGTGYDQGTNDAFSIEAIMQGNYQFQYQVLIDEKTSTYQGSQNGSKSLFTLADSYGERSYYRENNSFFLQNNLLWVKTENPYLYEEFLTIEQIEAILSRATYLSMTSYSSGEQMYQFQIATTTLVEMIRQEQIDIEDVPNAITLNTDIDGNLDHILFDLSSYGKFLGICQNQFQIVLDYSNFGQVEEIESPV